jgi:hypothetical protein
MKITLLDTVTGKRQELIGRWDPAWWADGNGSCDCNRAIFMGLPELSESNTCIGCKRFLVVEATYKDYTLREFNEGYPEELLRANGIT